VVAFIHDDLSIASHEVSHAAKARLDILRRTDDGFLIAEKDLELRGGGDPLGLKQSGFPAYRLADPAAHAGAGEPAELPLAGRGHRQRMTESPEPSLREAKRRSNPARSEQAGLLRFARNDGGNSNPAAR
jgi:RecG-like helicase